MSVEPHPELGDEMGKLRDCVKRLRDAMLFEGIGDDSPLGVWCAAQQSALLSLGMLVEMQTIRIEDRAEITERASQSIVQRHAKAIEELRAVAVTARAEAGLTEEKRRAEGLVLARNVAADIKTAISDTMVIREVRWNRTQHFKATLFAGAVLIGCFVGGGVWTAYRGEHETIARCLTKQIVDSAGVSYCPMDVVRGGS